LRGTTVGLDGHKNELDVTSLFISSSKEPYTWK